MPQLKVMGQSVERVDGREKALGECKYLDDIEMPGMLYAKVVRSPIPHGRIKSIDISQAVAMPGVRAVITGKDTPGKKFSFVPALADKYILCQDTVRCVGDEVAAIAADTLKIAEKAAESIIVDYEPLPTLYDPEESLKPAATLVHEEKESNLAWELHKEYGNVEDAFKEADFIFEDRYETSRVAHCCMETRGCIAAYHNSGEIKVWSPTQTPHTLRQELSRVLDVSIKRVRVIRTPSGGGFGSRLVMDMIEPIAVLLAQKTGRPVKLVNSRQEEFSSAKHRYPYVIYLKTGVTKEGKVLARQMKVIADNGAYNDKGPATINFSGVFYTMLHMAANTKLDGYLAYTNKPMGTGFRGFGNTQVHFAIESQFDLIAEKLGLDPMELRLRTANKPGLTTCSGINITSCGLEECIVTAAKESGWAEKRAAYAKQENGSKRRGIGMGILAHSGSGSRYYGYNAADAFIKVSEDGLVTLVTPAPELGQGSSTVLAQIVGEVLGIGIENIRILNDDTIITTYDLGAFGSRSTFVCGNAAKSAAENVKQEIVEAAAKYFDVPMEEIVYDKGDIYAKGHPDNKTSFEEMVLYACAKMGRTISRSGRYCDDIAAGIDLSGNLGKYIPATSYGCQVVELEVDLDTGQVEILKVTAVHDTGITINPVLATGQTEGAIIQGLGYALKEQIILKDGAVQNTNFTDYKLYRAPDCPEMDVFFVETDDELGPFGAKGIGETGLVPTAAAVNNALYHALGVSFKDLPITPEKVLWTK